MKNIGMIALLALVVIACSGEQNKDASSNSDERSQTVQTTEERQQEIKEMEQDLVTYMKENRSEMMDSKANLLLKRYRDYISNNPRDSMTAEYLFKSADLSLGVGNPEAAITLLNRLLKDFPDFRKAPEMMLFRGFIYETYMNQHAEAVKAYEVLIQRYPNHRLAEDARASIKNLTMSEEELIEEFKKKNADKES